MVEVVRILTNTAADASVNCCVLDPGFIVALPWCVGAVTTGLIPANFFHISTGYKLSTLTSLSFRDNSWTFIQLFCLQFVALLPTLFKKQLEKYEETSTTASKTKRLS
jgi:hypothetical protein